MSGLSSSRHARRPPTHPPRNPSPPRGRSLDSTTTPSLTIPSLTTPSLTTPATAAPPSNTTNHAPHHPPSRTSFPHAHAHAALELNRYTKIVRRLKWKLPFLSLAYHAAVDRLSPSRIAEAELMFKMDFFEYYMLIERALVHLLGVFGITVTRGAGPRGRQMTDLSGSRWGGGGSEHRYHANVLAALDSRENPLRAALGTGEVRHQLRRAKDLRNRWKTVGEEEKEDEDEGSPRKTGPLESYDLERILSCIFDGFDEAFLLAQAYVYGQGGGMDVDAEEGGTEEQQWEFMVEAMDWEAV